MEMDEQFYDYIITNKEDVIEGFHKSYWGREDLIINKEIFDKMCNGETLVWSDGEYSHSVKFSEEVLEKIKTMKTLNSINIKHLENTTNRELLIMLSSIQKELEKRPKF
jgi:hypothetical protein